MQRRFGVLSTVLCFLLLLFAVSVCATAQCNFTNLVWQGPDMSDVRAGATATLMGDGHVLIAGGVEGLPSQALKSADVFSPFTWEITPTKGQMSIGRQYHTATLLRDSSVLIAGGDHGGGAESSVEVYDRDKETFQPGPYNMNKARYWHTATALPDGNVLIVGGWNDNEKDLSSVELYDAKSRKFTEVAQLYFPRTHHTATLVGNQVVIIGGSNSTSPDGILAVEVYDVASQTISYSADLNTRRWFHTATLLASGKILIAGGYGAANDGSFKVLSSTELYTVGNQYAGKGVDLGKLVRSIPLRCWGAMWWCWSVGSMRTLTRVIPCSPIAMGRFPRSLH